MGATQQDAWIFWTLLAFLCGSVPFSLLIGFWVLHVDVRRYGDGNPGASNVIRVGDWRVGILAVLLDSFKGAAPETWQFLSSNIATTSSDRLA
jgi:glycerol-3-phosphate acyltransferase PlsY